MDDVVIGIVGYEKVVMPKKTALTAKFGVDTAENERGIPSFLLKMSVRKSRALGVSFFLPIRRRHGTRLSWLTTALLSRATPAVDWRRRRGRGTSRQLKPGPGSNKN